MRLTIGDDRSAQLVMGSDHSLSLDDARRRLERATLVVSADAMAVRSPWGQAALLTIAECAVRMFRGGVYLVGKFYDPVVVGNRQPMPLHRLLEEAGCQSIGKVAPPHAIALHVGSEIVGPLDALKCWTDGWVAAVSPRGPANRVLEGNEISGALAGAMGVSEAFRKTVLNDLRAGRRTQRISPLTPSHPDSVGMVLDHLPSRCVLLGLGNLGQATLWVLGLLPYADPAGVELLLQDFDTSGPENLDVQILTKHSWIGRKKTRAAAEWAEAKGFRTTIVEQRFTGQTRRTPNEPGLAFVGVDNLETRRFAAEAGFDLVIDAGLGATSTEAFDIRIHSFPGFRHPKIAWPEPERSGEKALSPALSHMIKEGRLDACGAMTFAGQSVGIPSTAVVAAAIQVAQACRAIREGVYCDLVDVTLIDPRRVNAHEASLRRGGILPFQKARYQ